MGHPVNQLETVVHQISSGYCSLKACWQPRDWLLQGKKVRKASSQGVVGRQNARLLLF